MADPSDNKTSTVPDSKVVKDETEAKSNEPTSNISKIEAQSDLKGSEHLAGDKTTKEQEEKDEPTTTVTVPEVTKKASNDIVEQSDKSATKSEVQSDLEPKETVTPTATNEPEEQPEKPEVDEAEAKDKTTITAPEAKENESEENTEPAPKEAPKTDEPAIITESEVKENESQSEENTEAKETEIKDEPTNTKAETKEEATSVTDSDKENNLSKDEKLAEKPNMKEEPMGSVNTEENNNNPQDKMGGLSLQDHDPHDIEERFVVHHELYFKDALREIQSGRKRSCWSWFILPTPPFIVDGVERGSPMNRAYCLRGDAAAQAFLTNGMLRTNYILMVRSIQSQLRRGATLTSLLGFMDDDKAISSFRLFERIGSQMDDPELTKACREVLSLGGVQTNKKKKRPSRGLQDWIIKKPKGKDPN